MRTAFTLLVVGAALMAGPAEAQILNVRPAPLADLRAGRQARHGEVVLGKTTLAGALRIFAEHLSSDSLRVSRAHRSNPTPMEEGTVWGAPAHAVRPRHVLDLGRERYSLFFDENERLVAAGTGRLPGGLTLKVLSNHYPSLRKGRRWHSGDQPTSESWSVALSSCVTLEASVLIKGQRVNTLYYLYTCPTKSAGATKTTSSR